ncbi:MAG: polyribonucleotide nucleotidyltransferase, partial [Deltaproteobacteria bacterium]|nr:polyribonucleotide nucleotidyltransferase [Deltaproteobacteria bacterium]
MKHVVKTVEIGGKTIEFDTGKYAKQAGGAVICSCGDSRVLVTAVTGNAERPFDFLPLTVMYQDRNGAYGTIPGSYFKREGRSDERETLISRMIDRPIRPLFPKHFRREMQIIATVMSFDRDNETDVLAMCGASAAMYISDAPFSQPVAGVRVCEIDGELVLNPGYDDWEKATINLVFAGTADAITMVEGECQEAQEDRILDALELAHQAIKEIVAVIEELHAEVGKPRIEVAPAPEPDAKVAAAIEAIAPEAIRAAAATEGKHERSAALKVARNEAIAGLVEGVDDPDEAKAIAGDAKKVWKAIEKAAMRQTVIQTGKRIDGRATDEIRDIWIEVGVAPRAHGSAIFTRGETQAFVTLA